MRKIITFIIISLFILIFSVSGTYIYADSPQTGNATSYTYTLDSENNWTRTQDAYLPGEILFLDAPLWNPEDLFVKGNKLYIADTGNGAVLCRNLETGDIDTFGKGILNTPTGIFVNENDELYVADMGFNKVFLFNPEGELVQEYARPTEVSFGKDTQYKPKKIVADNAGVLSVVSDGSFDGIIQLSKTGEFLGYFGYNTVPMTFIEVLQDYFFTDAQKAKLFNKIPLAFNNIAQDSKGINYTITKGVSGTAVKKHNISGNNIIKKTMFDELNFADIAIGPGGQIYAVTETGLIFEYDNEGDLLFSFGGRTISSERSGLLTVASGITVDEHYNLYVLDKERGVVHTFSPTSFSTRLHNAIHNYQKGNYEQSCEELSVLLMQSGNVKIVYSYLGKNELQLHNWNEAAYYFRNAGDRSGYSDAFWEIRNSGINVVLPWIIVGIIGVILVRFVYRKIETFRRARKITGAYKSISRYVPAKVCDFKNNMLYGLHILRHPFNGYDEVKTGLKGSISTATVLYILAFLVFAFDYLGRGFIFNYNSLENTSPFYPLVLFALPVGLFILCSYMVTEINDGKGEFKKIYIALSYSITPLICLLPFLTLLSHFLTLNEQFLISFSVLFIYGWTAILVVIAIREIHEYEFYQTFWNIILTFFMMIIVIFICSIIYMLWDKAFDTVASMVREGKYRAGI